MKNPRLSSSINLKSDRLLDEVVLGGIQMNNVQGSISPGMERDTVLLGMSFLNQLAIEIRGGEMVLRLPEP